MTLNPLLRTLTLFLTLSTATFGFAETIPKPSPVKVSLHRGALKYAPENTLPAFEKAIELGADFVEFDIRPSSDGVYYLLHDGKLDRTTDGKGPINQLSSKEIDQLDAGSWFSPRFKGERVPTLEQFLERVAGRIGLYVDAKEIVAEDLIEALRKHKSLDSAVVYGDVDFLVRLKELEPSIKTLAPLSSLEEIDPILKRLKTDAFDCSWDALSKELIDRCHQKGVMVFSDAMGQHENLEDYLQAIEWGIDLIQTDHPDRVREAIREYQRRKEIPKLIEGGAVRQTVRGLGTCDDRNNWQRLPFSVQTYRRVDA